MSPDTYPTLKRSGATDIIALALVQTIRAALDPNISLKTYRVARQSAVHLTRQCVRAAVAAGWRDDLRQSVEATRRLSVRHADDRNYTAGPGFWTGD